MLKDLHLKNALDLVLTTGPLHFSLILYKEAIRKEIRILLIKI